MFPLTNEDKIQIEKLNANKPLIFSLKKLFLNVSTKAAMTSDVNTLAAERIAIDIIQEAFHRLETIKKESTHNKTTENMV